MNIEQYSTGFDGVFRFTNPTDEDFKFFWNSKEYLFAAGKMTPMIIGGETLEGIQEIRKRAAFQLATREFYRGKIKDGSGRTYKDLVKFGEKSAGGVPPVYDDKILETMIETCLKPLPIAESTMKEVKKSQTKFRGSKAIGQKDNLAYEFKDDQPTELGVMSDK